MNGKRISVLAGACAMALIGTLAAPAGAQTAEIKEKPPLYTYEAFWTMPRAKWAEMEKSDATTQKVMDKALASGALVGYGSDATVIHSDDGTTHDSWWQSLSMAGVLNVLDDLSGASSAPNSVLASATKHHDELAVSRYYNWKAGSWKGAYTHAAIYSLKPDAPNDAIELLAKSVIGPMMEKLLADGTIIEWEIDVQAVHSEAPGTFSVLYVAPKAEGLDKVSAALRERSKASALLGPAMDSLVDISKHRDALVRSTVTYK